MDFEEAERSEPTQALELGPDDIKEDGIIQLRYVKFQNVNSVTVSPFSLRAHRKLHGQPQHSAACERDLPRSCLGASASVTELILI